MTVLEAVVAQLQAEMLRRPRYLREERARFDLDELGDDPEYDDDEEY